MVVSIPLNAYIARILKKMQESQMKTRDKRTKMMSELLNNIKRYSSFFVNNTQFSVTFDDLVSSYMHGKMPFYDVY